MSGNELELEMLNKSEKNRKGKIKFILCGVLIVLAVATGLYFGYKKLGNDPVGIYKDAINNTYKSLSNFLKEAKENSLDINLYEDPIKVELEAKLDSNMEELKNFTGLSYRIGAGVDYNKKLMNIEFGINNKNESIINGLIGVIENNIYLKSNELFSKVIHVSEEDVFDDAYLNFTVNGNDAEFNYDNYETILKEMKTILIDSLDKNKFETSETTITINDKKYNAKKIVYILDKDNLDRTIKFFSDNISKNSKLMDALTASLGIELEDLKDALRELPDTSDIKDLKIVIYTDKLNNIIGGELLIQDNKFMNFDCVNDEFNLKVEAENIRLTINKDENDLININFTEDDEEILDLLIETKKNKDTKVDYRLNLDGMAFSGTIEETNIKRNKDEASGDIKISVNTSVLTKQIRIYLDGKYKITTDELEKIDPTGSVNINNMTDAETMELFENLNKVLERLGLGDLLGSDM